MLPNLVALGSSVKRADPPTGVTCRSYDKGLEPVSTAVPLLPSLSIDGLLDEQEFPLLRKESLWTSTLLFGFAFTACTAFVHGVVVPTSILFTELFTSQSNARMISGVLVASYNVGAALAQPIQGCLFGSSLPLQRIYQIFCVVVVVGALVAGVSYKRSLAVLFLGRLCVGLVGGNQLFEQLLSVAIQNEARQEAAIRVLVTLVQLSYMAAFLVAALTLSVAPLETDNADLFPVNALTLPHYISACIAAALLLASLLWLRPYAYYNPWHTERPKTPSEEDPVGLADAILGLVGMAVTFGAPGIFVGALVINDKSWHFSMVALSLILAGTYFASALTIVFDSWLQKRQLLVLFAIPIVLLGAVPWEGLAPGVSLPLYCICQPLVTLAARVGFSHANVRVLKYARRVGRDGKPSVQWIVYSGIALELGMGITLSLSTVFSPSITGAVLVIGIALAYAVVMAFVSVAKAQTA